MRSNALDYELPESLIAQHPKGRRTDSRLLVVNKATQEWQDRVFGDLPEILSPARTRLARCWQLSSAHTDPSVTHHRLR